MDVNAVGKMLLFTISGSGIMAAFMGPPFVMTARIEQHDGLAVLAAALVTLAAVAMAALLGRGGRCRGMGGRLRAYAGGGGKRG